MRIHVLSLGICVLIGESWSSYLYSWKHVQPFLPAKHPYILSFSNSTYTSNRFCGWRSSAWALIRATGKYTPVNICWHVKVHVLGSYNILILTRVNNLYQFTYECVDFGFVLSQTSQIKKKYWCNQECVWTDFKPHKVFLMLTICFIWKILGFVIIIWTKTCLWVNRTPFWHL